MAVLERDQGRDDGAREQGDLERTAGRIHPEQDDGRGDQADEGDDGDRGIQQRRGPRR